MSSRVLMCPDPTHFHNDGCYSAGPIGPKYPAGIELIQAGKCPLEARAPIACLVFSFGHMLECHYPKLCQEANCSHYQRDRMDEEES